MSQQQEITRLLDAYAGGERRALHLLFPIVYEELRQIAHGRLLRERKDHTLNTTALVHEAYLELEKFDRINWQNRAHFFAVASQAMRNILVDYAIQRKAQKRGGNQPRISLEDAGGEPVDVSHETLDDLLALDEALKRLEEVDPRQARIVECRFFGDLSIEETAEALGISPATVSRDWALARAWLGKLLQQM